MALVCFLSGCSQITQRQSNAMGIGAGIGALLGAGAGGAHEPMEQAVMRSPLSDP